MRVDNPAPSGVPAPGLVPAAPAAPVLTAGSQADMPPPVIPQLQPQPQPQTGTLHLPVPVKPGRPARPRRAGPAVPPGQMVLTKKSVFMQRLADLVRTGHVKFVQGVLVAEKAAALAAKLDGVYHVTAPLRQQSRRRQRADAGARLVMWSPAIEDQAPVHWVLLVSAGRLPDGSRETWRDALSKATRLEVDGYELVRLTKPEEPRPVWTWRYTAAREQAWRESVIQAIRTRRDADLRQHIHNLWRSPGFAGIRVQVKKIAALIRSEWKRVRSAEETMPKIPARIGYVRRLPDVGVPITELMTRRRGSRPSGAGRRDKYEGGEE